MTTFGLEERAAPFFGRMLMKHIDLIAARMDQVRWERGIPVAELACR